jgi:hypothetical protein
MHMLRQPEHRETLVELALALASDAVGEKLREAIRNGACCRPVQGGGAAARGRWQPDDGF